MAGYVYPCAVTNVSDDFSEHVARGSPNPGTDYTADYGDPVHAVADGVISGVHSSSSGGGGRMIYLDLDDGNGVDYLHLSTISRSSGRVSMGELIGYSGASGYGSDWYYGPHLHISIRNRHGSHTYNAGNFDFDAMIRNQTVTPERRKTVTTIYSNGAGTWALAGDSPGMTANWIETRDQGLANQWGEVHGTNVIVTPDDFVSFRAWYSEALTTEGGSGGDSAQAIAAAVDSALADDFAALPGATVDAFGDALSGGTAYSRRRRIALLLAGVLVAILGLLILVAAVAGVLELRDQLAAYGAGGINLAAGITVAVLSQIPWDTGRRRRHGRERPDKHRGDAGYL